MAPFVQLKKREKELRRSNTFSKVGVYLLNSSMGVFHVL